MNKEVYYIYNLLDFNKLRDIKGSIVFVDIMNDLDFSNIDNFRPIDKPFSNIYINGNNHTISGLHICDENNVSVGLFSRTMLLSISNLNVENSYVYGGSLVGTFVGSTRELTVTNCRVDCNVFGKREAGCLAGLCSKAYINDTKCLISDTFSQEQCHDLVGKCACLKEIHNKISYKPFYSYVRK